MADGGNDYTGAALGALAGLLTALGVGGSKWLMQLQHDRGKYDEVIRRLDGLETKIEHGFADLHGRITSHGEKIAWIEGQHAERRIKDDRTKTR